MPGNRRRSSTAAENSPPWLNAARIAAASASVTTNIMGAWERRSGSASCFRTGERPTTRWSPNFRYYMKAGRSAVLCPTVLSSTPVIRGIGSCQEGERAPKQQGMPREQRAGACKSRRRGLVRARQAATCDYARGRRVGLRRPAVRPYERPRGACSSPCDAVVDRESVAADLFQSQAKAGPATATISTAIAIKRLIFASSDFP